MAYPSPRRVATTFCILSWIAVQFTFFVPPSGGNMPFFSYVPSSDGNFYIFQNQDDAVIVGAFSDRYHRFPRMELVPFLRKKGVARIRELFLTGHDRAATGALDDLQKNFTLATVRYPRDQAIRMRRTFAQIDRAVALKRFERFELDSANPDFICFSETKTGMGS